MFSCQCAKYSVISFFHLFPPHSFVLLEKFGAISLEMQCVMGQLVIPQITCMVMEGQRQNTYKEDKTEVLGKKT